MKYQDGKATIVLARQIKILETKEKIVSTAMKNVYRYLASNSQRDVEKFIDSLTL